MTTIMGGSRNKYFEIINSTVKVYLNDAEIRLFGSRATGMANEDSDYDILVITGKVLRPKEKMSLKTSIRKDLLKYGIRSDILIQNKKDIEKKQNLPGHVIRSILKDTIIL